MLAGMQDPFDGSASATPMGSMDLTIGPSMFETLGRPPSGAPSADEMAKQMEELQRNRRVVVKQVCSYTYDLRKPEANKLYAKHLGELMTGVTMRTHAIIGKTPLQFVSDGDGAGYMLHMDWIEFTLLDEAAAVTGDRDGH